MGWRELFTGKSAELKPDARVRWFGKLPTYGDYYSSPAEQDWVVELHAWIMKGYEIHQGRAGSAGDVSESFPGSRLVVRLPESEMTVVAVIQDYGGDNKGRRFPFCFMVGVPTACWSREAHETWLATWHVLEHLDELHGEVPAFLRGSGAFESVFGERQIDLSAIADARFDESWRGQASAIAFADWFGGVRAGLKVQEPEAFLSLAARWGDRIAGLDGDAFAPTFRLPLSEEVPTGVQVAGWLRWLGARMKLRERTLSLILSGEGEVGCGRLSVISRELVAEDFLLGTQLADGLAYVDDLSRSERLVGAGGIKAPAPGFAYSTATWLDFVDSGAGGS